MLGPVFAVVIGLSAGVAPEAEPCPTQDQLLARLRQLRAPVDHLREVAVATGEQGATLTARRDDGSALSRPLGDGDCAALTDAAAVVVLAWLTRLDGPPRAPLPVAPAPQPTPAVVSAPEPEGWTVIGGAGASAWWGDSATFGGDAYLAFSPHGWVLQPELVVFGQGERQLQVLSGYGVWSRVSVAPGVTTVLGSDGVTLRIELGVATGALFVGGKGFDSDQSNVSYDLGARAGLRLSYAAWPVRPFLGAGVTAWAVGHRLDLLPLGQAGTLPWADLQLTVGLELGR